MLVDVLHWLPFPQWVTSRTVRSLISALPYGTALLAGALLLYSAVLWFSPFRAGWSSCSPVTDFYCAAPYFFRYCPCNQEWAFSFTTPNAYSHWGHVLCWFGTDWKGRYINHCITRVWKCFLWNEIRTGSGCLCLFVLVIWSCACRPLFWCTIDWCLVQEETEAL